MKFTNRLLLVSAGLLISVSVLSGCDSDDDTPINVVGMSGDSNTGNSGESSGEETGSEGGLDGNGTDPDQAGERQARYRATFSASWSADTHPVNFPGNPHFSPLTGLVHNEQVRVWQRGQIASDGIKAMAETGATAALTEELQAAIAQGYGLSVIAGSGISQSPGSAVVEFDIDRSYPLVTLVSMLAPSPDWFVGVQGLELIDADGEFMQTLTTDLKLYDSGTDSGVTYTSVNQVPPVRSAIEFVNSFPNESNFMDGEPIVGQLLFEKI